MVLIYLFDKEEYLF